jgi:signal transduction histidine kinase
MHPFRARTAALLAAAGLFAGLAGAADPATPKEAEAMVKKGVAYLKANGKEKAFAEITNPQGRFNDRDLYLTVNSLDGVVLAHGANRKMVGVDMIDIKDIDGKQYMRERMDLAKTKQSFWHDLKFTNPVTKKIEPKTIYCERADDVLVCGGAYKPA